MASLDEVLNWGIPVLLLLVALGFIYIKFLEPYVWPMLRKAWGYLNSERESSSPTKKELSFE